MCPYYGKRYHLITKYLEEFQSSVDASRWGLLVFDDGWGQDWSELQERFDFARFVQIRKTGSPIRDARFSRNVFIKRTKSKWVVFKDPEVVVIGDLIQAVLDTPEGNYCRPAGIHSLSSESTQKVVSGDISVQDVSYRKRATGPDQDMIFRVKIDKTFACHWSYGVLTDHLRAVGGYDERLSNNAIWFRNVTSKPQGEEYVVKYLQSIGIHPVWIPNVGVYHLWHGLEEPHMRVRYYQELEKANQHIVFPPTPPGTTNVNASEGVVWGEQFDKEML